jgi:hypothetical protein
MGRPLTFFCGKYHRSGIRPQPLAPNRHLVSFSINSMTETGSALVKCRIC